MGATLILVHLGTTVPEYLYDCIYQIYIHSPKCQKIYVIVDESVLENVSKNIHNLNTDTYATTIVAAQSLILGTETSYTKYIRAFNKSLDDFWMFTTLRFFYIERLMTKLSLSDVIHIENDIMLYTSLDTVLKDAIDCDVRLVRDSKTRVIPSVVYIKNTAAAAAMCDFISHTFSKSEFVNDMYLLSEFERNPPCNLQVGLFNISPHVCVCRIYDGAALGQYLGGIDWKNVQGYNNLSSNLKDTVRFAQSTSGFKNETCTVDYAYYRYARQRTKKSDIVYMLKNPDMNNTHRIANLHIHSKQLYRWSSVFDILYKDIITGDRIASECDLILTTRDISDFHKSLKTGSGVLLEIDDYNNFTIPKQLLKHVTTDTTRPITIFVYTHLLEKIHISLAEQLDNSNTSVTLYTHNSDHPFSEKYKHLLDLDCVTAVYAQNPSFMHQKLKLLPIGIANAMWNHGNLNALYRVMSVEYKYKKPLMSKIYVNINKATCPFRAKVLDTLSVTLSSVCTFGQVKPYTEYLEELSSHGYCAIVRGNGQDTHRLWECVYLNVIPIIFDERTSSDIAFTDYLKSLDVYFILNPAKITDITVPPTYTTHVPKMSNFFNS